MRASIFKIIDDKGLDEETETATSYNIASFVLESNIKELKLKSNSIIGNNLKVFLDEIKSIENENYDLILEKVKDEKDEAILDAEASLVKAEEQDKARGNISELTSLNDSVLIANDLYDSLNKNFSVWNSLISTHDIT